MTQSLIERFILDDLLLGTYDKPLDPHTSLIAGGILDSLALLRLITFLEERFGITVEDYEVVPENFETLARMEAFISAKQPA